MMEMMKVNQSRPCKDDDLIPRITWFIIRSYFLWHCRLDAALKKTEQRQSIQRWGESSQLYLTTLNGACSAARFKALGNLRNAAVEYSFMKGLKSKYSSEIDFFLDSKECLSWWFIIILPLIFFQRANHLQSKLINRFCKLAKGSIVALKSIMQSLCMENDCPHTGLRVRI